MFWLDIPVSVTTNTAGDCFDIDLQMLKRCLEQWSVAWQLRLLAVKSQPCPPPPDSKISTYTHVV